MQAVKDKLHDMSEMRKVKSQAKAEEKAEKSIAKARMDVAHEVRLAKEAEAEMELHVAKAGQKVEREAAKMAPKKPNVSGANRDPADHCAMATGNTSLDHGPADQAPPTISTAGISPHSDTAQAPPVKKLF
ncbi:hypothetical protein SO802_008883 [Lithocarpus litseifolius]|uniref:Uncharacterized protein n=1 Tax=Lithocarpus litseifolius TaxID=425828 RepID=A0AAW2DE37_9ROSI